MAQVMKLRWEGVTPDQYEAMRETVKWESDTPDGLLFHAAWFRDDGITVIDLWESQRQFDDYFQSRMAPGIEQVGIAGQPAMKWIDTHAHFIPATVATPV